MAPDDGLPFRVELPEAQYLVLLKHAINRSRAAARLAAAVEHERKGKKSYYIVTGFLTDALALRAIALVHAPDAVPAIERIWSGPARSSGVTTAPPPQFCFCRISESLELFLEGSGAWRKARVGSVVGLTMTIRVVGFTIVRWLAVATMAVTAYFLS